MCKYYMKGELIMTNTMLLSGLAFAELDDGQLMCIDGGGFWKTLGAVCAIVGGAAAIVGGVCALAVPEPTMLTKVGGIAAIVGGVAAIGAGIAALCE
jgi:hypothetical protein